jgi:methylisocitrate lyase
MDEEFISPGLALRQAAAVETLQVPGAPFALAGRLIERMGFPAVYLSGGAFSAGIVGLPDVGLFTLTELVQHTTYLTRSVNIPAIVDADTGFGDTINVERTVIELESAGAAAIQLEDQQLPKRCGHLSGKTLIEVDAMCAKLRAASAAKSDDETVILARTDARAVEGLDAAIDRAKRYVDAGADWIFPEAMASEEEFAAFAQAIEVPLLANMTEFGKSPLLPLATFREMGYAAVIYPVSLLRISMRAMEAGLAMLEDSGTQAELVDLMQTREELYDLLDYADFDERDRSYFGNEGE